MSRTAARRAGTSVGKKAARQPAGTRRARVTQRRAGREKRVEPVGRQKLSVSVPAEMAEWVQAEADRLKVSVSFIFVDAVARARRQNAWGDYLEDAGDDDITDADVAALRDELRAGGVSI